MAHSLLNLVTTAVFPMASLEQAVSRGQLHVGVSPPATRIEKLWALTERADSLESLCAFVVASLDDLYKSILTTSSKHTALIRLILNTIGRIAIVVPKLYYANMLLSEPVFSQNRIYITTANRFDGSQSHDRVIVVGDFSGKRFDPLKCRAAADIVVLLHECETKLFDRRKAREMEHERKLNAMNGPDYCGFDDEAADADLDSVESFASEFLDVEEYIDNISVLDISKFAAGFSSASGGAPTAEVLAVGRFVSGEQIIFSKYYRAVVYKPENTRNPITETDVDKLSAGDILVFAKRDDFTRNIVDSIYETLQTSGKLSKNVLRATEKAQWWKKVLRDYQLTHDLSYRQLREELVRFGCSLTEVSIRQWLVEESHIVGPRDEETLRQIAEMTQDGYLLDDVPGYFDACRVVRAQRRRILELIGEAIEDKLRGHQPPPESELEIVYDNVENLSETLELQSISFLNESVTVPVNLINKPMSDLEVT